MRKIAVIFAQSLNDVIGQNNELPWAGRLKSDMSFFKQATEGGAVIAGRKTYESLPELFRPLPSRLNVVLTGDQSFDPMAGSKRTQVDPADYLRAPSIPEALQAIPEHRDVYFIGGQRVFEEALMLPELNTIYQTIVEANFEGDTPAPPIDEKNWGVAGVIEARAADATRGDHYGYQILEYRRHDQLAASYVNPNNARSPAYRSQLEAIKQIEAGRFCPFCKGNKTYQGQELLGQWSGWELVRTNTPYLGSRHHLMLIPDRHLTTLDELNSGDWLAITHLLNQFKKRYRIQANVSFVREGVLNLDHVGATVGHFHLNILVPEIVEGKASLMTVHYGPFPTADAVTLPA
nr:Dihydrofolate reductase [uncultured bacterium]